MRTKDSKPAVFALFLYQASGKIARRERTEEESDVALSTSHPLVEQMQISTPIIPLSSAGNNRATRWLMTTRFCGLACD